MKFMNQSNLFKLCIVLFVAGSMFLISSCNQSGSKIKIGFIVKEPSEQWFQSEWKHAQAAADKYKFEVVKLGATDAAKVLSTIDTVAASGCKGFIICPPDVELGTAIVNKAKSHNLKVMSVDDRLLGSDGKFIPDVPHMGINAKEIGKKVGESLYKEMKNRKWKIEETAVCAISYDVLETLKNRTGSAIEMLISMKFPKNRIFKAQVKSEGVDPARNAAMNLINKNPKPVKWLILGFNDNSVIGAVRAFESHGFDASRLIGIGINGTECIPEFEKQTPTGVFASVFLSPKRHGFETTEMMYKWIKNGEKPPLETYTSGVLMTRENYLQVLNVQ